MTDELKPTIKQLHELRRLAQATGTSFTPPRTRRQATQQITAMRRRPNSSRIDRQLEHRDISDALATTTLASAPHDDEITGYGSSARWTTSRDV
jgi:hypothetical protein